MGHARSRSFLPCLRRKTRSPRRKETRRVCREELRTSKNIPRKRLSSVFRVRSLLQQTLHPKSLRVSVPPFPPCLAPQTPPSRENPYLISIRGSPECWSDKDCPLERVQKQWGFKPLSHQPFSTADARKRVPPRGERNGRVALPRDLVVGKRLWSHRVTQTAPGNGASGAKHGGDGGRRHGGFWEMEFAGGHLESCPAA